ncbi:MAG: hypothetical protein K2I03_08420 [Lachnospiraceae bacterium]|nr:hypothetical protein [Lachnospiraceae bacterium]
MVDARIQIRELLKSISYDGLSVKMGFPKTVNKVPLITFFEIGNTNTAIPVRDYMALQIDVWEESFEKLMDLTQLTDEKMTGLGLKRDYVSPDSDTIDPSGYYRKVMRYSRHIDIRTNRLID